MTCKSARASDRIRTSSTVSCTPFNVLIANHKDDAPRLPDFVVIVLSWPCRGLSLLFWTGAFFMRVPLRWYCLWSGHPAMQLHQRQDTEHYVRSSGILGLRLPILLVQTMILTSEIQGLTGPACKATSGLD